MSSPTSLWWFVGKWSIRYLFFKCFVKQELIKSHDEYIKGILEADGKDNGSKFKISKKLWSYARSKRRDTTGIPVDPSTQS